MNISGTLARPDPMLKTRPNSHWILLIFSLVFLTGFEFSGTALSHPRLTVDRPLEFQAIGVNESRLDIPEFGLYSLYTKSSQGTAVQLVDRMNGPGKIHGNPGAEDGRVDAFLDQAEYKVLTHSDKKGTGNGTLTLKPFIELNPSPLRLVELKSISTTLGDWEKRSYWLEIKKRRWVALEAAGRHLSKLKLWRDGVWLVDSKEQRRILEPVKGQPWVSITMAIQLNPGWYLVSAYGGPSGPWAEESRAQPFHLRMGIPRVGPAERRSVTIGPWGINRYRVPGEANYFRIDKMKNETPANPKSIRETFISVEQYSDSQPYRTGSKAVISYKAVQPMAEMTASSEPEEGWVVTLQGKPGDVIQLQHFKQYHGERFSFYGPRWVGVLQSGFKQDHIDLTGFLHKRNKRQGSEKIAKPHLLDLTVSHPWERRFNLLEPVNLHFEVKEGGAYRVEGKGAQGEYRFEPVDKGPLSKYKAPDFKELNTEWELNPGHYEMSVRPKGNKKGILTLQIRNKKSPFKKWYSDSGDALSNEKNQVLERQFFIQYPQFNFLQKFDYRFEFNHRPGVHTGLVIRKLPIDLSRSLPVFQKAGESLTLPITLPATGTIQARAPLGHSIAISVDGSPFDESMEIAPGPHTLRITNPEKQSIAYSLVFRNATLGPATPLPSVPDAALAGFPEFPKLLAGNPQFFDLERKERRTFDLRVKQPALYRLESSGLMKTRGTVRTRTLPTWLNQAANGTGRNFLLSTYLSEGQYQVTVETQGNSKGHLGLHLTRNLFTDAGPLTEGVPSFKRQAAQTGLIHTFTIAEAGKYHIQTQGQNNDLFVRLEDNEGWPVIKPNGQADVTRYFEPGTYRWMVLPKNVPFRLNTLLKRIPEPVKREGHGPHRVSSNSYIKYQWKEPAKGESRTPDRWRFSLPAKARVSIKLSKGIIGELTRMDGKSLQDKASHISSKPWDQYLDRGDYSLDIRSRGINNQLDYTVSIRTDELLKGLTRKATSPGKLTLSVGKESMVHLHAYGEPGIRATLLDDQGNRIDQNDELDDDWNFHIIRTLPKGRYHLQLETIGKRNAATQVSFSGFTQSVQSLPLNKDVEFSFEGKSIQSFPVLLPEKGDLWVATAKAKTIIGMTLEKRMKNNQWKAVTQSIDTQPQVAYVSSGESSDLMQYRLRLWPVYKEKSKVSLKVLSLKSQPVSPSGPSTVLGIKQDIYQGMRFDLLSASEMGEGWVYGKLKLKSPGIKKVAEALSDMKVATDVGRELTSKGLPYVVAQSESVWVLGKAREKSNSSFVINTLYLDLNQSIDVRLPSARQGVVPVNPHQLQGKSGYLVALAESHTGKPGLIDNRVESDSPGFATQWAIAGQSAITILPVSVDMQSPSPRLRLWDAESSKSNLPVSLKGFLVEGGSSHSAEMGMTSGVLKPKEFSILSLPSGKKEIQINVESRTALMLMKNNVKQQTLWAGEQAGTFDLLSDADQIILLNIENSARRFNLLTRPASHPESFAWNSPTGVQRNFPQQGIWLLDIQSNTTGHDKESHIVASGERAYLTLTSHDGRVWSGTNVPLKPGKLQVAHGPGSILLSSSPSRISVAPSTHLVKEFPASIPLSGKSITFETQTNEVRMLHLRTTHPVLVETRENTPTAPPHLFAHGALWNRLVIPGSQKFALKPVSGSVLEGAAFLYTSSVQKLSEGEGPKTLLAPGDARLYSFTVEKKSPVGVGVKGIKDSPATLLWDEKGRLLGQGVVQMKTLDAGTYYLSVENPPDRFPIEVQAVVLGIKPPDSGPPDSVKQKFMMLVGKKTGH